MRATSGIAKTSPDLRLFAVAADDGRLASGHWTVFVQKLFAVGDVLKERPLAVLAGPIAVGFLFHCLDPAGIGK